MQLYYPRSKEPNVSLDYSYWPTVDLGKAKCIQVVNHWEFTEGICRTEGQVLKGPGGV